jgi:hypothetical protein
MDITISFTAQVGTIKAFNINDGKTIGIVNQSFVMSLKNKKFPKPGGGNINNRDTNKRHPPFPSIPGLRAVVSSDSSSKSTGYSLDMYLVDQVIDGVWWLWGYAATIKSEEIVESNTKKRNGSISASGELGSSLLNYSYFVPYGIYEGSGSSGSYSTEEPKMTSSVSGKLTSSQYKSSYEGKPSNSATETYSWETGTIEFFNRPPYERESTYSSRTVEKVKFIEG